MRRVVEHPERGTLNNEGTDTQAIHSLRLTRMLTLQEATPSYRVQQPGVRAM